MEEVPKLDDQIANLVEYKKQLEDQSSVVNQRLIDEIVSTVRIGNDWAMQVERKDLELSPSHLHDHEDVELAVLYENGKQPVDVFFANFESYYVHASEKLRLLFLKRRYIDPFIKKEVQEIVGNYSTLKSACKGKRNQPHCITCHHVLPAGHFCPSKLIPMKMQIQTQM